ncbi:MAG TPA: hypothetical protein VEG44_10295 [Candidatus Acidoferrales bacterium]|nr:hypothetical protein [Candidatus Acidoferrales bacterium]
MSNKQDYTLNYALAVICGGIEIWIKRAYRAAQNYQRTVALYIHALSAEKRWRGVKSAKR